jgi:hypothetical protein
MYMDSELDTEMLLRGVQTFTLAAQQEDGYQAAEPGSPASFSVVAMVMHSVCANNQMKHDNRLLILLRALGVCVIIFLAFLSTLIYYNVPLIGEVAGFLMLVMLFLGVQSVLTALYLNYYRLLEPATADDACVVEECCKVAAIFGVVSGMLLLAVALFLACSLYDAPGVSWVLIGVILPNAAVLVALMINMVLLLLDVEVSQRFLDQLHTLADEKALTLDRFSAVRDEIHRRVTASRFACDYVVAPALASIVGIVAAIFIVSEAFTPSVVVIICSFMAVQLKELFYVAVAFVYVAKVNARADELTAKLSQCTWGGTDSDMIRLSIWASARDKPINFTLMFTRLSWRSVIASLVLSLLIGTIRSIVISQVA